MLTAVALRSHVRNRAYDAGSKSPPLALRRFRPDSSASSGASPPSSFMVALPFLFDQKPRVCPPPGPRHRLPNSTVVSSPSARTTMTGLVVVEIQLGSTGVYSVTVY